MNDNPDLEDKEIKCLDCGLAFTFSVGEQKFFGSKGLSPPKRCLRCRTKRKDSLVKAGGEEE